MASKKASEGIALLSMYNDEEDEEMEDVGEETHQLEEGVEKEPQQEEDDYMDDRGDETRVSSDRVVGIDWGNDRTLPQLSIDNDDQSHKQQYEQAAAVEAKRLRTDRLAIVDYGHDELAMSPEPDLFKEGDLETGGRVMLSLGLQSVTAVEHQEKVPSETVQILSPSELVTPHSERQEQSESEIPNHDSTESGRAEGEHAVEGSDDIDPLDKFLPSPPKAKCSEELQEKVRKFIAYKRAGKSFNAEVRNKKNYRNPDFLLHAVTYQGIDQTGSCFRKDVFDPHGYDQSDYYDEIEADMKQESERKELERKKSQQVDFISGGTQPGAVAMMPKINVPISVPNVVRSVPAAADAVAREGRQNKKSKWDKVDAGGPDSQSSTVGAHAALLSASNAGAGYMAFAQQKRREVEERRSGERKTERRT